MSLMAVGDFFSGAFGWWNNYFQSSLWSNCASSTQNLLPLRIFCPPVLMAFLDKNGQPNYFFSVKGMWKNIRALTVETDCMGICVCAPVCLIFYGIYNTCCLVFVSVCPPALRLCVYCNRVNEWTRKPLSDCEEIAFSCTLRHPPHHKGKKSEWSEIYIPDVHFRPCPNNLKSLWEWICRHSHTGLPVISWLPHNNI